MPPSGSSMDAEMGVAQRLAEEQRAISIAEFFEKNKHMLGFDSEARALVTAVKEGVDNSLDAAEEADILPDIYIDIQEHGDYYTLVVEDNGPGITKEQVPRIFGKMLYGSRFHKREQSLTPDQQILLERDGEVETVEIGEFCDAFIPPGAEEAAVPLPEGIRAPVFNRETLEVSWQPVTDAIRHRTDERVYRVSTERGRSVAVTGNHSLFSLDERGQPTEVRAEDLGEGDRILAPRRLAQPGSPITDINLLDHLTLKQLEGRRLYVYGFDEDTLRELESGEVVRKKPTPESPRRRYYHRYNGVDILQDSLRQYIDRGYLPASTVIRLGWEARAADCELRTYQVGGDVTALPVTQPVTTSLVDLIALYISEGHGGDRQIGLTFGSHEAELIETAETAVATVGGHTTTVTRERNSVRVKAFGSPLVMAIQSMCGSHADAKRIPSFIFNVDPDLQLHFIETLFRGDGSDAHPSNEIDHTTTSETLARQLSLLFNLQGILASTVKRDNTGGYADDTTVYRTKIFGEDIDRLPTYGETDDTGQQQYKRVPADLLDGVRVDPNGTHTVPDTIPGLLYGAGIGAAPAQAKRYQEVIEAALDDKQPEVPYYTLYLQRWGLLDDERRPTDRLRELWSVVTDLHGLTDLDVCLLSVTDIEEIQAPRYVYDISVPGETRVDENFVVANQGALFVKNSRGQQGIGISAAVLYSQLTSGKPARITSKPKGAADAQYFELIIDTDDNEPDIRAERTTDWDRPHGTRIELDLEANLRARNRLHDYVEQTAVVNPHARIELREPKLDAPRKFERVTERLPAKTHEIRPHPHGVELGTLIKMLEATDSYSLGGFLREEFARVGRKTADSVIDAFRDRHFGRELSWTPPAAHEDLDLAAALTAAVANKGKEATAAFVDHVVDAVSAHDRVSHGDLVRSIHQAADRVEEETDRRFGATVRTNAIDAAWAEVTGESTGVDRLPSELYRVIDAATSNRKSDRVKHGLATRLGEAIVAADRPKHRFTHGELTDLVDDAADATEAYDDATFGETARENVVEAIWATMRRVNDDPPKVRTVAAERDLAAALVAAMRATDIMAPPTDCLAPITAELVEEGLRKEVDAAFVGAVTRDPAVHGGDPFVVEAGIAYGGALEVESSITLQRYANRVPLVYQRGACAITDVVRGIDWRNYNLDQPGGSGIPSGPMVLVVHVASTNVPFTSESKDAVANIPEIEREIELAVREVARSVKRHISERRSLRQRREKEDVIARVLPEIATKVSSVLGRDQPDIETAMARIMNNVHVSRSTETADGGQRVTIEVRNYDTAVAEPEVTDIVDAEPAVDDGATVVAMDGEWYVRWAPRVGAGESATLRYDLADGASGELAVSGIETEKLTIDQP